MSWWQYGLIGMLALTIVSILGVAGLYLSETVCRKIVAKLDLYITTDSTTDRYSMIEEKELETYIGYSWDVLVWLLPFLFAAAMIIGGSILTGYILVEGGLVC